ncbi:MAG: hypothetical protein LLG04_18980 [Parachlamydia sp.]|nr:hypothetical protein [Parachlamydia sp.]
MIETSSVSIETVLSYELIVNPTPTEGTASSHPIPMDAFMLVRVTKIRVFAVTEVLATAIVPATKVACPMRALAPALREIPFPAVPNRRFPSVIVSCPLVNVRSPAVRVALPEVKTKFPEVRVALPEVRIKFPEDRVTLPVVKTVFPAPLGVKVKPIAALAPVPVKTFPEAKVMAFAVVVR